jgi:hypothetical protein
MKPLISVVSETVRYFEEPLSIGRRSEFCFLCSVRKAYPIIVTPPPPTPYFQPQLFHITGDREIGDRIPYPIRNILFQGFHL